MGEVVNLVWTKIPRNEGQIFETKRLPNIKPEFKKVN